MCSVSDGDFFFVLFKNNWENISSFCDNVFEFMVAFVLGFKALMDPSLVLQLLVIFWHPAWGLISVPLIDNRIFA